MAPDQSSYKTLANRMQSFALYRLKCRSGEGFSLTLAFVSARIRSLSNCWFLTSPVTPEMVLVEGGMRRFAHSILARCHSRLSQTYSAGEDQWQQLPLQ